MREITGRDERTLAVENASYRWAYNALAFALLLDWAYRGLLHIDRMPDPQGLFSRGWDLPIAVQISFAVSVGYQAVHGTLGPQLQAARARWREWLALGVMVVVVQVILAWAVIRWTLSG